MNKKIGLMLAALLVLLALATGCGTSASGSSSSETASSGQAQKTAEAEAENDSFVKSIKERGYLVVGCKTDVPDLSFYDEETGEWSGLEVELAYKTAAHIFGVSPEEAKAQGLVKLKGVTVADREAALQKGTIDLMLATYTITKERKEKFAFSDSYYTDYIGIMVRDSGKSENANSLGEYGDINSIADLDGKYIGVPRKATTRKEFLSYIESMNTIKCTPVFNEYNSYDTLFKALKSEEIDAMSVDVSILKGYVDSSTKILDIRFGGQKYGAAVLPENSNLLNYVNEAIAE